MIIFKDNKLEEPSFQFDVAASTYIIVVLSKWMDFSKKVVSAEHCYVL